MKVSSPASHLSGQQTRKIVLLPLGTIEQHGPFLPVNTDLQIAQLLAEHIEQSLSEENYDVLLLPIFPFGCSWEHRGLGTISLSVSTLTSAIHDLAKSLTFWEVPALLVLVNWHGGNDLGSIATEVTALSGIPTTAIPTASDIGNAWEASGMTSAKEVHAGAVETAILQAYFPELVPQPIPQSAHCEPKIKPAKVQPVLQAIGSQITSSGIWGAPEDADPAKGKELIERLAQSVHTQIVKVLELVEIALH